MSWAKKVPESLLEAETLDLSTLSPFLPPSHRVPPGNQSFAVLFPFNRCGLIVHPLAVLLILCFYSLSWSRRCEAQWDGRFGEQQAFFCPYLISLFFCFQKPRLGCCFDVVKSQNSCEEEGTKHTEGKKAWVFAYN